MHYPPSCITLSITNCLVIGQPDSIKDTMDLTNYSGCHLFGKAVRLSPGLFRVVVMFLLAWFRKTRRDNPPPIKGTSPDHVQKCSPRKSARNSPAAPRVSPSISSASSRRSKISTAFRLPAQLFQQPGMAVTAEVPVRHPVEELSHIPIITTHWTCPARAEKPLTPVIPAILKP